MAANSPPPIAPDLHGPLTPESWEAYHRTITRWWAQWDAITEFDSASDVPEPLLERFVHHPDHKGKSHGQVISELHRSARHAQGLYKLRIKYPKPGPATDADKQGTRAAHVATMQWQIFGGGDWQNMNAREIAALRRKPTILSKSSESMDRERLIDIDHQVLAMNHYGYLQYQKAMYESGKSRKLGLNEYLRFLEEGKKYPNESNIAEWVRRSRPKAAGLAALALVAGAVTGISAFSFLGSVLVVYLVLSFLAYSWLLAPEHQRTENETMRNPFRRDSAQEITAGVHPYVTAQPSARKESASGRRLTVAEAGAALTTALETLGSAAESWHRATTGLPRPTNRMELLKTWNQAAEMPRKVDAGLAGLVVALPPDEYMQLYEAFALAVNALLSKWQADLAAISLLVLEKRDDANEKIAEAERSKIEFYRFWRLFQVTFRAMELEQPEAIARLQLTPDARTVIEKEDWFMS